MVVIEQEWLYSGLWLYSGINGCNQAKMNVFRQSGCIRVKLFYSDKLVVFGKSGCIRTKLFYLGKSCCIRAKVVIFR